jgi:predicted O-methyltransferase YrrM
MLKRTGWLLHDLSSSFELELPETIDLLFCDSDVNVREEEVRRFLDRVSPFGLILMHDAGSNFQVVRRGALLLEQEGLISVVLVSTPRGLVVAQKRQGRI